MRAATGLKARRYITVVRCRRSPGRGGAQTPAGHQASSHRAPSAPKRSLYSGEPRVIQGLEEHAKFGFCANARAYGTTRRSGICTQFVRVRSKKSLDVLRGTTVRRARGAVVGPGGGTARSPGPSEISSCGSPGPLPHAMGVLDCMGLLPGAGSSTLPPSLDCDDHSQVCRAPRRVAKVPPGQCHSA